ncbi:GNAT family N-acetyltransferase [Aestuariibacter sp. AA17]|uniref:GNAT family N-acetyltransferase n=1 Tax=Fluctibacter corallii TaxID=2984329 RepID=A0ABT3A9N9_9ALTE|nr:GNAT family N-acetyltransferase [Aestuariibacter sp. AA17]MCV2885031.1 GNAT family N-acetyltransferase [Aestuariibacter sp. AA17]
MELSAVEIFGYCASALVAYSLTQSSIIKLRWINLFGSSSFCMYGIIIGAYPVAVLNGFIAMTNVYFLRKILTQPKQNFSVLRANQPSNYVNFFLDFHKEEIKQLFPSFLNQSQQTEREYFLLMENTEVVGVLSGYRNEDAVFVVDFDFVIPAYRDCKLGHFALGKGNQLAKYTGYSRIAATADSDAHAQYLQKLGFSKKDTLLWTFDGAREA